MLKVRHGKGNKQRQVYLSEGAIAALDDWLAVRGTGLVASFCRSTGDDASTATS